MRICILILAWILSTIALANNVGAYPVQWSPELKIKSLNDIPAFLKNVVINAVNYDNDPKPVKTCDDFFQQTKLGHHPVHEYENGYFIAPCVPLVYLANATPAKVSYIRDFNLQKDYGQLPAMDIIPNIGDGPQPSGNLASAYQDLHLVSSAPNKINIESKQAGMGAMISLVGRGDFDGDGYDDILLVITRYATYGTLGQNSVISYTRQGSNEPIIQAKQLWYDFSYD